MISPKEIIHMIRVICSATIACGLFGLLCSASAQEFSPATSGPQLTPAAKYFLSRIQPGATRATFLLNMRNEFAQLDADANGELSAADIEIHKVMSAADFRWMSAARIMRADADNDGIVTEEELRRRLQYDRRMMAYRTAPPPVDSEIRQLMAADANGDGKVTIDEAKQYAWPAAKGLIDPMRWSERITPMLAILPAGKNALSLKDLEELAGEFFSAVDADKNDAVTKEEIDSYRAGNGALTAADEIRENAKKEAEKIRAQKAADLRAECRMPKPSDSAKVLVLSAYEADALSTTTIGSQDITTVTGVVAVEEGSEQLYVVIASFKPVIWRFSGALDRIERVVLAASSAGNRQNPADISIAGAISVPADRVTFLKSKCLGYFSETPSIQAAKATASVRKELEREPAIVAGRYKVSGFAIPSGEIRTTGRPDQPTLIIEKSVGTLTVQGGANVIVQTGTRDLARDVARYYPGGIVQVDPTTVVASKPAERYEVLPNQAGLLQLVQSGALTQNRSREFLIQKKIRFPAELNGAHSVKFLLLKGVPEPDGDPGHSCVLVEETGEPLRATSSCR